MTGRVEKYTKKDKSTSWKIIIEMGECKLTGKRLRKFQTVNGTKKEAERLMNQMLAELQTGTYIHQSNITVGEWLTEWMGSYVQPTYSPTTADSYATIIRSHLIPAFGHIKLQELSPLDLQRYYNSLSEISPASKRKISQKTTRNINMCLMAALSRAELLEMVKKNVAKAVTIPKYKKYKADVFDRQEIIRLLNVSKNTDMYTAIAILATLGLRRGEALALRFDDVDFNKNKIHITKSLHKVKGQFVEKPPKTEAGNRVLDATPSLMEILQRSQNDYMRARQDMGTAFHDRGFIIRHEDGRPYDPDWFSRKFKQFLTKHGFREIRLHDMRHTNASTLLTLGVSPKVAQKRLGHSSFNITMDTYSHVLDEVEQEATKKLEESLFPPIGSTNEEQS